MEKKSENEMETRILGVTQLYTGRTGMEKTMETRIQMLGFTVWCSGFQISGAGLKEPEGDYNSDLNCTPYPLHTQP